MTRIVAIGLLGLSVFAAEPPRQQPELTTRAHFDFAPGGTIRVNDSFGCLSIEGWDRPEVEVTVTRYGSGFYAGQARERKVQKLEKVKVNAERRSAKEIVISTQLPPHSRWFTVPFSSATRAGADVEYLIRVPRASHLAIHHGHGSVIIADVSGAIDASATSGDIVVMLPDPGPHSIDAKTKVGTIYNDFGDPKHSNLIGERFASEKAATAQRVRLRTGIGGISIQEITSGGY
jgi:hypothetical protein